MTRAEHPGSFESTYTEDEFRRDPLHYDLYARALESVVDFLQVESFVDAGCSNGSLIRALSATNPHLEVAGLDYFEWARVHADERVRGAIRIVDLRRPLADQGVVRAYDVCNCTEVAEHLEPEFEEVFLDNLRLLTRDLLVLSWSRETNPQHLNPRHPEYVEGRVAGAGFEVLTRETDRLRSTLRHRVSPLGYQWWGESVLVLRRRSRLHRDHVIHGTDTVHTRELEVLSGPPRRGRPFQESFDTLKRELRVAEATRRSLTVLRLSDGDFYFVLKREIGSAAPGRRALTVPYGSLDMASFRQGLLRNDLYSFGVLPEDRGPWLRYLSLLQLLHDDRRGLASTYLRQPALGLRSLELLGRLLRGAYPPHQCVYALVATRWIFRAFGPRLGLIGNERKLELIRELMAHDEYRRYLGLDRFADYVPIPQLGAADDVAGLEATVGRRLAEGRASIYLVGMGHAKLGLLSRLPRYSDAVFVDVGVGIDAIAGLVDGFRPYFARWTNHRLPDYDYSGIDRLVHDNDSQAGFPIVVLKHEGNANT